MEPEAPGGALIDWNARFPRSAGDAAISDQAWSTPTSDRGVIDFERLAADPNLAPSDDLRRCLRSTLLDRGAETLDYADPAGWGSLRETVSRRLRAHLRLSIACVDEGQIEEGCRVLGGVLA